MAVPKEGSASPYGTPKGATSPLRSPLVGDAKRIVALDLNAGVRTYNGEVLKSFAKFKADQRCV